MALNDLLLAAYSWADEHALAILITALLVPGAGSLAAWVGKAGRNDRDGRLIASALVGFALAAVLLEVVVVVIARLAFDGSVLAVDVRLLAAPLLCLAGTLLGVHLLFPLNELGSVRTAADIGLFVIGCVAVLWAFSQFRGWGVVFWGGIGQLVLIGALGWFVMRRLYRRAFRRRRS